MEKGEFTYRLTRAVRRLQEERRLILLDADEVFPVLVYLISALARRDDGKPVARAIERVIQRLLAEFDDVDPTLIDDRFHFPGASRREVPDASD